MYLDSLLDSLPISYRSAFLWFRLLLIDNSVAKAEYILRFLTIQIYEIVLILQKIEHSLLVRAILTEHHNLPHIHQMCQ